MDDRVLFEKFNLKLKSCRHGAMMFYANDIYIGRSLDLYGEFSEGETELFNQILRPGMVVVDVGANIGAHTVWFAKAVGPAGQVLAFEPQRILYQVLCGNIALNLHTNVIAINAGLAANPGVLHVPGIDYGQTGNFGALALVEAKVGEAVPLHTLDACKLTACHLIKIDVEGMERQVLEGGRNTLAEHKPLLYVENDRDGLSKDLIGWLFDHGYRLYWHLPLLFNPQNHFRNGENVFGNTVSVNMLCIPQSTPMNLGGFREITSPDDTWKI